MALYFTLKLYDGSKRNFGPYHLYTPKPAILKEDLTYLGDTVQCIRLSADGNELTHIANNFSNIPHVQQRQVTWHGDFANFILDNYTGWATP